MGEWDDADRGRRYSHQTPSSAPRSNVISRSQFASHRTRDIVWLTAVGLALIGLQVLYAFHWRVNSDEPQHLHVVWAWTQGLLPYRDVFDNHTPLFQMLSAPLMWMVGERAGIVVWMRLGQLPFWALALWCTWRIGRTLFSSRAGLLAAAMTALAPLFGTIAIEFRPDMAWTALWLVTITLAIEGPATPRCAVLVGLAAGCAIAISMKTLLLLGCSGFALLLVAILQARDGERLALRTMAPVLFAGALGLVLLPLCLALFFAAHGAWQDMLYDVFFYNHVPGILQRPWWHAWILPASMPVLVWFGIVLLRGSEQPGLGARRATMLLSALIYSVVVTFYWPLPTKQDVLPFIPLLMVGVAGAVAALAQRRPAVSRASTWLLLGAELVFLVSNKTTWIDKESEYERILATVLALTSPADTVMDCKGGAIFRTRPIRQVLEGVTRQRMWVGLLPDDIPEHLRQTRVVLRCDELPQRTREFLDRNYLVVSDLIPVGIAGKRLSAVPAMTAVAFDVGVAASYAAITDSDRGGFQGSIDGIAYDGPRTLAPGPHTLVSTRAEQTVELIWSEALARGFRPNLRPSAPQPTAPRP
jgi:hypothetical protein